METMADKAICWIDVESTGIRIKDGHRLLEVACLITDLELNILDETGFRAVIKYTADEVVKLKSLAGDYVLEMHTKTGLWDSLEEGTPLELVNLQLEAYIQNLIPEPQTARLGGNSISLDRNFLDEFLPSVYNHLHYRSIDVSSVSGLAQYWYKGPKFQKKTLHSAFDDITESIEELRFLRKHFFKEGVSFE